MGQLCLWGIRDCFQHLVSVFVGRRTEEVNLVRQIQGVDLLIVSCWDRPTNIPTVCIRLSNEQDPYKTCQVPLSAAINAKILLLTQAPQRSTAA